MLPTIRSRCQRFAFARPGLPEISTVLHRIAARRVDRDRAGRRGGDRPVGGGQLPRRRLGARPARDRLRRTRSPSPTSATCSARPTPRCSSGRSTWSPPATPAGLPAPGRRAGRLAAPTWACSSTDLLGHLRCSSCTSSWASRPADAPLTDDERARSATQAERGQRRPRCTGWSTCCATCSTRCARAPTRACRSSSRWCASAGPPTELVGRGARRSGSRRSRPAWAARPPPPRRRPRPAPAPAAPARRRRAAPPQAAPATAAAAAPADRAPHARPGPARPPSWARRDRARDRPPHRCRCSR